LLNLCTIAAKVQTITKIDIKVVGFDTGVGLPAPKDYRDHPEFYQCGEFAMDQERLSEALSANATLILGKLTETIPQFMERMTPDSPLGFLSLDVDYYSSATDALVLLTDADPNKYLPLPLVYVDDIIEETHNSWCGELLAVNEFNSIHRYRKIEQDRFLRARRLFKHARWLDQIYLLHVLDHPSMQCLNPARLGADLPAS